MNKAEKMYENVGVLKVKPSICANNEKFCEGCIAYDKGYIPRCRNAEYSPFTAEKQLSLIKWIAENKEECRITYEKEYKWCTQTDWQSSFCYDNFSASLANLINNLWQDLTDTDKVQIKEILE